MKLVRGLNGSFFRQREQGTVVTIGNFDGVHLGHQSLIERCVDRAKAKDCLAVVVIFEPHPQEFFARAKPDDAVTPRLDTWRDKYQKIAALGVDVLLCLPFNAELAALPAERFIEEVLLARLQVKHLILGDDFRFGQGRRGDYAMLQQFAKSAGYTLESLDSLKVVDQRVSSTAIREALNVGDCEQAALLLGRPYSISGKVQHGEKRGRTLGFPTANIALKRRRSPVQGVFAVRANWQNRLLQGVANIGPRPTVNGLKPRLEVHFFDFDGNLYGQRLTVEIEAKIRAEQRFASLNDLREQIAIDVEQAKSVFANATP